MAHRCNAAAAPAGGWGAGHPFCHYGRTERTAWKGVAAAPGKSLMDMQELGMPVMTKEKRKEETEQQRGKL